MQYRKPPICGSVLVVSDQNAMRKKIGAMLRGAGHHVCEVDNHEAAAQCLRHPEFAFDAVISTMAHCNATAETYAHQIARMARPISVIRIGMRPSNQPSLSLSRGKIVGWLEPVFVGFVLLNMVRVSIEHAACARQKSHE